MSFTLIGTTQSARICKVYLCTVPQGQSAKKVLNQLPGRNEGSAFWQWLIDTFVFTDSNDSFVNEFPEKKFEKLVQNAMNVNFQKNGNFSDLWFIYLVSLPHLVMC